MQESGRRRPCGKGDSGEMVKYLETEIRDGDCVLFKGSNSMGLSAVADQFVEMAGR